MSGAIDWLAVGDIAEERSSGDQSAIGGGAGRLVFHAATLKASIALVGKVGDDPAGRHLRDALTRLHVNLQWLRTAPGLRTTSWVGRDADPQQRRVERGADLGLRLDELPARSVAAALTVVSGYSLSVEPARSAVMGALAQATARGGHAALWLEAELLWWMNARITRRVLEPALALADSVALTAVDAAVLFGAVPARQILNAVAKMGPRIVYLIEGDGGVLVREGSRIHRIVGTHRDGAGRQASAGAASFWVGLAQRQPVLKAAEASVRYAEGRRSAGAPKRGRPS